MGSSVEATPKIDSKDRSSSDYSAQKASKKERKRSRSRSSSRMKQSRRKREKRDRSRDPYENNYGYESGEVRENNYSRKDRRERRGVRSRDRYEKGDGYESGEIRETYYNVKRQRRRDDERNRNDEKGSHTKGNQESEDKSVIKPRERKTVDMLTSKTGGAYIPPAKLRMMQAEITDKSSAAFQRIAWEALKKSIHGYINKINTSNIGIIARELLHENIIRGRGLLCKSIIQAQAVSPTFTNVYAALVAVVNSKFPNIGELLLKRLVLQFRRGFKQNNKAICISGAIFVAHLVNQSVAHEILALEILTLLIESPTDDSIEVAIAFLKECGQKLSEVSSRGMNAIFEMLRNILHEGKLDKRIQYMIEVMFQIRKDGFKDHAAVIEELDIVEEDDQFTHLIKLDDVKQTDAQDVLNVFKFDEEYEQNEGKYKTLSKEILQSDSDSSGESGEGSSKEDSDEDEDKEVEDQGTIIDNTETNLIILRRTIYLTIQSSLDFEECAHKLLKMELKPGQEIELCHMFLDCCAEQRTYEKFYGLLAQRFCQINKTYIEPFQQIFRDTYATTHRLDTNRLRNVSKFFAHLLFTDAIGWEVFEIMKMNEEDTNSSSRIFIKILFQELAEYMGLGKLNERLKDRTMQGHFAGLFPRDNPKNTRFSINFFTSIGLGGLTDELREHLKNIPKNLPIATKEESSTSSESSSSSDSSSESDSSSNSDDKTKKKSKGRRKEKSKSSEKSKERENSRKDSKEDGKGQNRSSRKSELQSGEREVRPRTKPKHKKREQSETRTEDETKEGRSSKNKKDYEWVKGRYEDNIQQLRSYKKAFQRDDADVVRKEVKKEKRDGSKERNSRRERNDSSRDRGEGRRKRDK